MTPKSSYPSESPSAKLARQRVYRSSQQGKLCECNRPKTLKIGSKWCCPFCGPLETLEGWQQIHKPTAGIPKGEKEAWGNPLTIHRLLMPAEVGA